MKLHVFFYVEAEGMFSVLLFLLIEHNTFMRLKFKYKIEICLAVNKRDHPSPHPQYIQIIIWEIFISHGHSLLILDQL